MLADGSDPRPRLPRPCRAWSPRGSMRFRRRRRSCSRLAAVLGKVFWTDALARLSGADSWQLEERMHALERKEFVRREHRSAVAGSKQYVFVHALVRDGAYGQMSRAARADVHRRVADWIETLPRDRADDRIEILAHHLLEAIEYSRAAGLDAADLVPRAAKALRESGDRAWSIGALERRARLLHPVCGSSTRPSMTIPTSCSRSGSPSRWAPSRRQVPRARARAHRRCRSRIRGRLPRQRSHAASSSGSAGTRTAPSRTSIARVHWPRTLRSRPRSCYVVAQVARFLALAGRYEEAHELVEQAIAMAEELGDDELLGDALNKRGDGARVARRPALGGGQHAKHRARAPRRTRSVRRARYINSGRTSSTRRLTSHAPRP